MVAHNLSEQTEKRFRTLKTVYWFILFNMNKIRGDVALKTASERQVDGYSEGCNV